MPGTVTTDPEAIRRWVARRARAERGRGAGRRPAAPGGADTRQGQVGDLREPSGGAAPAPVPGPGADLPAVDLMGVRVHLVDEAGAIDAIVTSLDAGLGGRTVTPNVDILRQAVADAELRGLVERAELVIADGKPLVWASRLQGTPLPERVAASALVTPLARALAERDRSLFLLGGVPGVTEQAAAVLAAEAPGLRVSTYAPPPGFERDPQGMDRVRRRLADADPDVVLCAFGCPKQERLMADLYPQFPSSWFLGVGGALTIISGVTPMAPGWMREWGLEWLHRLRLEPRRLFRRYIIDDLPFAITLLAASTRRRVLASAR